jgi:hypothetical protein
MKPQPLHNRRVLMLALTLHKSSSSRYGRQHWTRETNTCTRTKTQRSRCSGSSRSYSHCSTTNRCRRRDNRHRSCSGDMMTDRSWSWSWSWCGSSGWCSRLHGVENGVKVPLHLPGRRTSVRRMKRATCIACHRHIRQITNQ